jgi:hypothetical protein
MVLCHVDNYLPHCLFDLHVTAFTQTPYINATTVAPASRLLFPVWIYFVPCRACAGMFSQVSRSDCQLSEQKPVLLFGGEGRHIRTVWHRMVGLVNWKTIWKEAAVAYSRQYHVICLKGLAKSTEDLIQYTICPDRYSNRTPASYKCRDLSLHCFPTERSIIPPLTSEIDLNNIVTCQRIARQRLKKHPALRARNNRTNVCTSLLGNSQRANELER